MAVVKPSEKFQIVIPRQIREKLGIRPGQTLYIDAAGNDEARISTKSVIDRYAGTMKGVWGPDPDKWLREERDAWDK